MRLAPATGLLVLTYAFTLLLWSPLFDVANVAVQGTDSSLADQIRSASGAMGLNLFTIQTNAVRAAVTSLPDVKAVSVVPGFPNRLNLGVTPYVPAAVWRSGGKAYLVTDDGFVIKAAATTTGNMVVVDDPRPIQLGHGDQVDAPSIQAAKQIRSLYSTRSLSATRFIALESSTLAVESAPGKQVLFSLHADLARQVSVLAQVLQRGISFSTLDLRAGDSPYYR